MGALSDLAFGDVEKALAPRAVGRIVRSRYAEGPAAAREGKAKDLLKRPLQRLGNVQRSRYVEKAARDQNSSPGATIVRRGPVGPGVKPSRDATRGNGPGRFTRRNEGRDANSSPRVSRVTPRSPKGKFVSHDNDVMVIHPDGNKYRSRQPRTSALGIFKPNSGHVSRVYNGKKAEQTTFGKAYGRSNTRFGTAPSRGKRIA